ncbi:MAG: hypothetical protein CM15mV106_250 [uncultured marine virus]|nr:MAG: hypothetical protein CM15mV106_250 [uncultured marine virus]
MPQARVSDTTADLTDTTGQGPIPDFAEGDRSPASTLASMDSFQGGIFW